MGTRGPTALLISRLLLNVVIVVGSALVLYGIVESRANVRNAWGTSQCLLFATTSSGINGRTKVEAGHEGNCQSNVAGASVFIVVALLLSLALLYQLARGKIQEKRWVAWLELTVVLMALFLSILIGAISSAGIRAFCSSFRAQYTTLNCKSFKLCSDEACTKEYEWRQPLQTTEIGAWLVVAGWFLQMLFSVYNVYLHGIREKTQLFNLQETETSDTSAILESTDDEA